MDSYIIDKLWKPDVKLYVDYGTKQTAEERKRLPEDVIVKEIDLHEYIEDDGISTIPLRNLLFATVAVNYGDEIAIGGVKGDLHYDKTKAFARRATRLFNSVTRKEASKRKVKVTVPFANCTKRELIQRYIDMGGTVEEIRDNTWTCHQPKEGKECGECIPCKRKTKTLETIEGMIENGKIQQHTGHYFYHWY